MASTSNADASSRDGAGDCAAGGPPSIACAMDSNGSSGGGSGACAADGPPSVSCAMDSNISPECSLEECPAGELPATSCAMNLVASDMAVGCHSRQSFQTTMILICGGVAPAPKAPRRLTAEHERNENRSDCETRNSPAIHEPCWRKNKLVRT